MSLFEVNDDFIKKKKYYEDEIYYLNYIELEDIKFPNEVIFCMKFLSGQRIEIIAEERNYWKLQTFGRKLSLDQKNTALRKAKLLSENFYKFLKIHL